MPIGPPGETPLALLTLAPGEALPAAPVFVRTTTVELEIEVTV